MYDPFAAGGDTPAPAATQGKGQRVRPQPGRYVAQVVEAVHKLTKNDKWAIELNFQILGDEFGGQFVGQTISRLLILSQDAFGITVQNLRACGWKGHDLTDLSSALRNPCAIVLETRSYEGQTYLDVKRIYKLGFDLKVEKPLPAAAMQRLKGMAAMVKQADADNEERRSQYLAERNGSAPAGQAFAQATRSAAQGTFGGPAARPPAATPTPRSAAPAPPPEGAGDAWEPPGGDDDIPF